MGICWKWAMYYSLMKILYKLSLSVEEIFKIQPIWQYILQYSTTFNLIDLYILNLSF